MIHPIPLGEIPKAALRGEAALRADVAATSPAGPSRPMADATPIGVDLARRYELALQAAGQVFYSWESATGGVLRVSWNCREVLGYTAEELTGAPGRWVELIHPDDREGFVTMISPRPPGASSYRIQYRFRHKSGRLLILRDVGRLIADDEGRIVDLVGFVVDVTEKVREETRWRESESTLHHLFRCAPMGLYVLELLEDDVRILSANRSGVEKFGIPEEELRGRTLTQLGYSREEIDLWVSRYRRCLRSGRPKRYEYTFDSPSGRRWFSGTLARIDGGRPERPRFCFIAEDVTGRKDAEAALAESNRERQAIMDSIPDFLYVLDLEGRLVRWNRSLERSMGYSTEELQGRPAVEFFPSERQGEIATIIRDLFAHESEAETTSDVLRKDGTRASYEFVSAPLRDGEGRVVGMAGIGRDISDRLALEAALREQAQAVETINRAGLALAAEHDLEALVRSISDASVSLAGAYCGAFVPLGLADCRPPGALHSGAACRPSWRACPFLSRCARLAVPALRRSEPIRIDDVASDPRFRGRQSRPNGACQPLMSSLMVVPVKARDDVVLGALVLAHPVAGAFDQRAERLVAGLAAQAAVALDNARLVEGLQRSRDAIEAAYDETIAGWARALDLRDQETEGHSRRVAEMTVRLAAAMGVSGPDLVHVRRGALLHDIGKMGIPDGVLRKPGPLDPDEWAVMKKHPSYAYAMLRPISFLGPALDIPFGHHERWDGGGYPRGLRGRQIPLAARIFAAVDIYDALIYDRPYRKAWPRGLAVEHIRSLSGTHLDPEVVAAFLRIMDDPPPPEPPDACEPASRRGIPACSCTSAPNPESAAG